MPTLVGAQDGLPFCASHTSDQLGTFHNTLVLGVPIKSNSLIIAFDWFDTVGWEKANRYTVGFSQDIQNIRLGTNFSLYTAKGPLHLGVTPSATLLLGNYHAVTASLENILGTDSLLQYRPLSIHTKLGGQFFGKHHYAIEFSTEPIADTDSQNLPFYFRLALKGDYLSKPQISPSLGFSFKDDGKPSWSASAGIEVKTFFGNAIAALGASYSHSPQPSMRRIETSVFFNPIENLDRSPPTTLISVRCHDGQAALIALTCADETDGSGLKQWTVVISTMPTVQGTILRSYSGGTVAPSTIIWDLKDSEGNLYDSKPSFFRLVAQDRESNVSVTEWRRFEPCKQE